MEGKQEDVSSATAVFLGALAPGVNVRTISEFFQVLIFIIFLEQVLIFPCLNIRVLLGMH